MTARGLLDTAFKIICFCVGAFILVYGIRWMTRAVRCKISGRSINTWFTKWDPMECDKKMNLCVLSKDLFSRLDFFISKLNMSRKAILCWTCPYMVNGIEESRFSLLWTFVMSSVTPWPAYDIPFAIKPGPRFSIKWTRSGLYQLIKLQIGEGIWFSVLNDFTKKANKKQAKHALTQGCQE